jgi:ATP dependent DNA ligase domain
MLMRSPLARDRRRPEGFVPPALLTPATKVPTGPEWIHELKHDGIRLLARKDGDRVRLWSRHGRNRTSDFATIAAARRMLPDVIIDGEAVAHCEKGLPDFHRTLSAAGQREACLLAFEVLAMDTARIFNRCRSWPAASDLRPSWLAPLTASCLATTWMARRRGDVPARVPLGARGHRVEKAGRPAPIGPALVLASVSKSLWTLGRGQCLVNVISEVGA